MQDKDKYDTQLLDLVPKSGCVPQNFFKYWGRYFFKAEKIFRSKIFGRPRGKLQCFQKESLILTL